MTRIFALPPIPITWEVSARDAAPCYFCRRGKAPIPILMTPVRSSWAVVTKIFAAVLGEMLPRSFDGVAASTIVGIGDLADFNCVGEEGITGQWGLLPLR